MGPTVRNILYCIILYFIVRYCLVWCGAGLVDSHPIMSGLDENEEELTQLSGSVRVLIYGMVGWLSVVTVAALCIFIGVYVRMSRMARSLDDAETGSSISSKSSRSVLVSPLSKVRM